MKANENLPPVGLSDKCACEHEWSQHAHRGETKAEHFGKCCVDGCDCEAFNSTTPAAHADDTK